jgi:hypothetical protein
MKTVGRHEFIPIDKIDLDRGNPRIAKFLEIYSGEPTAEQLFMALGAGGDEKETETGPTFNKLKQSIITNGGIIQPIIVNRSAGRDVCIDGNTRLALYRSFRDEKVEGDWKVIPAIVYNELDEEDIDAIRLQAHLVGPRQWDPYSKAKYLSYLRKKQHFPFDRLVDFCGPCSPNTPTTSQGSQGERGRFRVATAFANHAKHCRFSNSLLVDGLPLGFGNEFLKTWIIADWIPDWINLQTRNGNGSTGRARDQLTKYFYSFIRLACARFNFG